MEHSFRMDIHAVVFPFHLPSTSTDNRPPQRASYALIPFTKPGIVMSPRGNDGVILYLVRKHGRGRIDGWACTLLAGDWPLFKQSHDSKKHPLAIWNMEQNRIEDMSDGHSCNSYGLPL